VLALRISDISKLILFSGNQEEGSSG